MSIIKKMKSLLGLHRGIDKKAQKEFNAKINDISRDFIRFQIEHKARAFMGNYYQNNNKYPPNAIIDFICSFNQLHWRPMTEKESEELTQKING